ncbi:MAG: hypothetical protein NAOJABEB_03342 [Steroidobacteraceae bacterium]|nr:hypothetical protein [Steroidobacteraceae bacterium]
MKHRYSLAHLSALKLTPPQLIDAAAQAGCDYVGLRSNRVTSSELLFPLADDSRMMRKAKARLSSTGVGVFDIELAWIGPSQSARDFVPVLEVAAELGAHDIIGQVPDPDRGRAASQFAQLCVIAQTLGTFVNLEFPSWTETPGLAVQCPSCAKLTNPVLRFSSTCCTSRDPGPRWTFLRHFHDTGFVLRTCVMRLRRRQQRAMGSSMQPVASACFRGRVVSAWRRFWYACLMTFRIHSKFPAFHSLEYLMIRNTLASRSMRPDGTLMARRSLRTLSTLSVPSEVRLGSIRTSTRSWNR